MARASDAVVATSPRGTGTPNSRRIAFAWYSWIFMRGMGLRWVASRGRLLAAELPEHPHDGVVVVVDHALLQRDDRVVGDLDVLRADLGAALRDVAEPDPRPRADELPAVHGIQRVHVQLGQAHEEARPEELGLVLVVVPNHVTDVLAEEALDALPELLPAVDVLLHHPIRAVRLRRARPERRDLPRRLVVERHVGDQVLDQRERLEWRHRDGLALSEDVHARHAHETRLPVDLGAARAALPGLAVPADGEIVRLGPLDPVNHVEDDHPLLERDPVLVELPALRVAAEDVHRDFPDGLRGRRHFFSSNSVASSDGIAGNASWVTWSCPSRIRTTTFTLPRCGSVFGKSSRVCPPRLSLRSRAASATAPDTARRFWRSRARCQPGL